MKKKMKPIVILCASVLCLGAIFVPVWAASYQAGSVQTQTAKPISISEKEAANSDYPTVGRYDRDVSPETFFDEYTPVDLIFYDESGSLLSGYIVEIYAGDQHFLAMTDNVGWAGFLCKNSLEMETIEPSIGLLAKMKGSQYEPLSSAADARLEQYADAGALSFEGFEIDDRPYTQESVDLGGADSTLNFTTIHMI